MCLFVPWVRGVRRGNDNDGVINRVYSPSNAIAVNESIHIGNSYDGEEGSGVERPELMCEPAGVELHRAICPDRAGLEGEGWKVAGDEGEGGVNSGRDGSKSIPFSRGLRAAYPGRKVVLEADAREAV